MKRFCSHGTALAMTLSLLTCPVWAVPVPKTAAAAKPAAARQDAESILRRQVAWQVALDRVGFSPGLIDGKTGGKTRLATSEFQRVHGLKVTGELDEATAAELQPEPDNAFGSYTVTADDLREVGPAPSSWVAKSRLSRLGHEDLTAVLGEKFRCTRALLSTLNPGRNINGLSAGDKVIVPIVAESTASPQAERVEINLSEKVVRVIDSEGRLAALFHCSVAADKAKMPSGQARVVVIAPNPDYKFDPKKWPEVREHISAPLIIPPGPRNPVGRCWIGLSLPGYGMHGTPNPELIGKTGSHGCFRLANWDAVRLSRMVKVGTPVKFVNNPRLLASR